MIGVKKRVTEILRELNIPPNMKGFENLREAIVLCVKNPESVYEVYWGIYQHIAQKKGTTRFAVERNIRYAIEQGMRDTSSDILKKYFRQIFCSKGRYVRRRITHRC